MPPGSSEGVRIYYPKYQKERLIELLREGSRRLSRVLPLREDVVFGSYEEGRQTVASDVDVLIVYDDPKREDDYAVCAEAFGLENLEAHVYTVSECERLRAGGSTFVTEAERNGAVVWRRAAK
jgi:predicted nucleotidyltransferase